MIDTENKILKFGYGDIAVGSSNICISFRGIRPPVEVGTKLTDEFMFQNKIEVTTNWINFYFKSVEELFQFEHLINNVCKESPTFIFKDYVFDFSNYNYESAMCVIHHLDKVKSNMLLTLAC